VPSATQASALINALYQHSPEAIGVSVSGVHVMVNPAYLTLFGYPSAEDVVGRPVLDLIAPPSRALVLDYIARRGQAGVPDRYEVQGLRSDGVAFDMDVRVSFYVHEGTSYTLVVLRDVTERNDAQRAMAESREFYRALFEVNTAIKLLIRPDTGQIVDANLAAAQLYGWPVETLRQMRIQDINVSPASQVQAQMEAARSGGRRFFEFRHRTASGSIADVEVYSGPIDVNGQELLLSIIHDVTGRKALEEQLRQAQKLEAIGRLAGGVAHDFNNLLMVMMGYGELAAANLSIGTPARVHVDGMLAAAGKARDLTGQLLAFSRRQVLQPQVVSLNTVILGIVNMIQRTLGPKVELALVMDPELPPTLADPGQLDQVLLNLVINARDAMPAGGVLTVTTSRSKGPTGGGSGIDAGFVCLEVKDTGVGMDNHTLEHIFDPFFTTKGPGEGTGLGLATVYGIVSQSGGAIEVDSAPGAGSAFRVLLPVAAQDAPVVVPLAPAVDPSPMGHVLLVDDQPDILEVVATMLECSGFHVATAASADEAQAAFADEQAVFELLISDVVMPGRSGVALAHALTQEKSTLQVLLISGDLQNQSIDSMKSDWGFLQKPFSHAALLDSVRTLLSGRRKGT
jgi:two-component system, cell cycle sensor histidine kinase and response regulator CckA